MALIDNLVYEITTSTGTGNLTTSAASSGFRGLDAAFSTASFMYTIRHQSAAEWEVGIGHMSAATTFVRDTPLHSSNGDAAVDFSAGTKDIVVSAHADQHNWRGLVDGLTVSRDAGDVSHDINITVGVIWSQKRDRLIFLSGEITKLGDAVWAEGDDAGGMLSGQSLPTSGFVYFWIMTKDADGTVDVLMTITSTDVGPTPPAGWSLEAKFMALLTDGDGNFVEFFDRSDGWIEFDTSVLDYNATPGITTITQALTIPADCQRVRLNVLIAGGANTLEMYATDTSAGGDITTFITSIADLFTDASQQISFIVTDAADVVALRTWGYQYPRGRDL